MTSVVKLNSKDAKQNRAPIWNYYEEINETTSKCIKCKKLLKYDKTSTNNLHTLKNGS